MVTVDRIIKINIFWCCRNTFVDLICKRSCARNNKKVYFFASGNHLATLLFMLKKHLLSARHIVQSKTFKMRKLSFIILLALLAFVSCKKDGSAPGGGTISATVGGKDETFNNISVAKNTSAAGQYSLYFAGSADTSATADIISITIDGSMPVATGTYSSFHTPMDNYFPGMVYKTGGADTYSEDINGLYPITITITSLSSKNVQGTFSGALVLYAGTGVANKIITNGKFNVNFK